MGRISSMRLVLRIWREPSEILKADREMARLLSEDVDAFEFDRDRGRRNLKSIQKTLDGPRVEVVDFWPINIGLCDGSQKELKVEGLRVDEDCLVSANIDGFEKIDGVAYSLQAGWDPDDYFNVVKCDGSGSFVYKEKREEKQSLHLFYGCMGKTLLRLIRTENGNDVDLFSVWIDVRPCAERMQLFRKMLAEICYWNPFLACSNALGQSRLFAFRFGSYGLYEGGENIAIEVGAIRRLIEELNGPLFQINKFPSVAIVDRVVCAPLRYARRMTPAGQRKMVAVDRHQKEGRYLKVRQHAKRVSFDTVYHRAIAGFLRKVFLRAQSLGTVLDDMCDGLQEVIKFVDDHKKLGWEEYVRSRKSNWRDGVRRYVLGFLPDDILFYSRDRNNTLKASLSDMSGLRKDIGDCIRRLRVFLGCDFLRDCKSGGMSFDTSLTAFPQTSAYREIFAKMSLFIRMRFVWRFADGSNDVCNFEYDEEGRSAWVRKYSMLYESWVFLRLMRGLEKNGFLMENSYRQTVFARAIDAFLGLKCNTPITVSVDDGDFGVEVMHGVVAPALTESMRPDYDGFCCNEETQHGRRESVTPDFAIVFKKQKSGRANPLQYVIVLDAKSGMVLKSGVREQMRKYSSDFYIDVRHRLAHQVWFIYSGPINSRAGVEFNSSTPPKGACWQEGVPPNILGYWPRCKWTSEGIAGIGRDGGGAPLRGFVRANACTVELNDVFSEFMRVQVRTARKFLS